MQAPYLDLWAATAHVSLTSKIAQGAYGVVYRGTAPTRGVSLINTAVVGARPTGKHVCGMRRAGVWHAASAAVFAVANC
jgi:hypothetical protein